MKALFGAGLKAVGVRLAIVDSPIGPTGVFDGRGSVMPDVEIQPPGFDDFGAP